MSTFLNKKQLAFILDITSEEARAKMCVAYSRELGKPNAATYRRKKDKNGDETEKKVLVDPYPDTMLIEMLSKQLNLPTLQEMVDDVQNNYLNRPATKKWILCDYPEKKIKLATDEGKQFTTLSIPPGLKSLAKTSVQEQIKKEWAERYPKCVIK